MFVFSNLVTRLELKIVMEGLKLEARKSADGFGSKQISALSSHLSTRLLTWLFFSLDLTILPSFFLSFIIFTVFFSSF